MRLALAHTLLTPLRRWRCRQMAIHELMALDDRILRDIGLHRGEIRVAVEDLLNATTPSRIRTRAGAATTMGMHNIAQAVANNECFESAT